MNNPIKTFVYSFHMPLFFMISGFFFPSSLNLTYKNLIVKKCKQLLLPYVTWTIVYFLLYNQDIDSIVNVIGVITTIWFLPGLFLIYFITYFSFKKLKNTYLIYIFYILYILIGGPWGQFIPAFFVGIFLRNNSMSIYKFRNKLLLFSVLFGICLIFWRTDFWYHNFKVISLTKLDW
jgi:fucose 4-O-acetylase-like acetyltransferase